MTKREASPMTYRCPTHIIGMSNSPDNAAPPVYTILADGLLTVIWGTPVHCKACDDMASARAQDTMAFPLYAPEIYPGVVDRPTIARDRVAYDYGRPPYYIPTTRLFADETTSVATSHVEDQS